MSSVSHILRQTREAKGITLEEVAQRTYIKLPYLVALEEGDIEKLPAPVYIHGYIRQYAKLLGLNGSELVLQYQQDAGRSPHPPAKLALSPASRIASLLSERGAESEQPAPAPSFPPPDMRETSLTRMSEPAPIVEAPRPEPVRMPELASPEPALIERKVPQAEPAVRETVAAPEPTVREVAVEPSVRELSPEISTRQLNPAPAPLAPWEVQQAKQQAHQILSSAQREAQEMRVAAERYADQVLAQLESEVNRTLQTVRNGRAYLQSRRRKLQES
ncbi:MAG TPA: helix-turn-helix domain-containing protein [Stenomitos sp.]